MTRRDVLRRLTAVGASLSFDGRWRGAVAAEDALQSTAPIGPLDPAILPSGVRSRFVDGVNGLRVHVLEAGYETSGRRAVVLLHGFPELAYSWRRVMGPLAAA